MTGTLLWCRRADGTTTDCWGDLDGHRITNIRTIDGETLTLHPGDTIEIVVTFPQDDRPGDFTIE